MERDLPTRRYYVEIGPQADLVAFHGATFRLDVVPSAVQTISGWASAKPYDAIARELASARAGQDVWVLVWTDTYRCGRARNILAIAGSEWLDASEEAVRREKRLLRALMDAEDAAGIAWKPWPGPQATAGRPRRAQKRRDDAQPVLFEAVANWQRIQRRHGTVYGATPSNADPEPPGPAPSSRPETPAVSPTVSPPWDVHPPPESTRDSELDSSDLAAVWAAVIELFSKDVVSRRRRAYLPLAELRAIIDDTALLRVPDAFRRDAIESHLRVQIAEALSRLLGRPMRVALTVRPRDAAESDALTGPTVENPALPIRDAAPETAVPTHRPRPYVWQGSRPSASGQAVPARRCEAESRLNPEYTFETFVVGLSNRFAHAAAVAVAESPAMAYNPLFIYGGSGGGKTHLLHAIGHRATKLHPDKTVRYVPTEEFTNDFINSLRDDKTNAFQRRYRDVDILLIDDIQLLESREQTQEEFFHTFNTLHNANRQIVITSDRSPKQLATFEDRLRTRLEWGLLADIEPPDLGTRIAALQRTAARERLLAPSEVLEFIATHIQTSIRRLEGALIR